MIVLIDNYDSFVHNLGRYLVRLGQDVRVVRNDGFTVDELESWQPSAIVVSPGPCTPLEAGRTLELLGRCDVRLPVLGICLGHQAIAAACGAQVVRASRPMHGQADWIHHDGMEEFAGIEQPFLAGRYHSLVVDESTLPADLSVSARTSDGTVMALRHRSRPWTGWQFHPESVLTEAGFMLLAHWLERVKLPVPGSVPPIESEVNVDTAARQAMRFWELG
jgi:anthranilate synthase/aminodeoxychorismate synthase-like glutamine amidotransferase